jgi:hypothetical protein
MGQRAILARANPDIQDVLVALAAAHCLARRVLNGITAATLVARGEALCPTDGASLQVLPTCACDAGNIGLRRNSEWPTFDPRLVGPISIRGGGRRP